MRVMGIDQSYTSTGIVILEKNNEEDDLQYVYAYVYKSKKQYNKFVRAYNIATYCLKIAKEYQIDHIMLEGIAYNGLGNASRDLAGLLYVLVTVLGIVERFPLTLITPTQLKKHTCRNGHASKQMMIARLPDDIYIKFRHVMGYTERHGLSDLADAYHLAVMYFDYYEVAKREKRMKVPKVEET